jgi:hypothetical protein
VGPTQLTIHWVPGAVSPVVTQPGREAHYSPSSTAKVKNGGAILLRPHTPSVRIV